MDSWVLEECASLDLGDKRLNKRTRKVLSNLGHFPLASIPSSCKGWHETKAAYRFFSNPKISSEKILTTHKEATTQRTKKHDRVLVVQDTTELNYSGQHCKQGVGPTHHGQEKALLLHPSIVVSESGICLGVYDDYQWYRKELMSRKVDKKTLNNERLHKKHVREKESYRWVLGYKHATELAQRCPDTHVIAIADREGDIYDLYEEARNIEGNKADWLVRIRITNRAIINEAGKRDTNLLHEKMNEIAPQQIIKFNLPYRNKSSVRQVQQELRMSRITLHPPTGRRGKLRCKPVEVTVLLAKEINTPVGEEPVIWWLMTSIPIHHLAQPYQLILWYLQRWQVETFFKVLKSGCQVEQLQLKTEQRTKNCLALYLIIAWRILFLTSSCKSLPDGPCTLLLECKEWQTAWMMVNKKALPCNPPTIREAVILIAKMGGYLARKNDSPPGPKAIWLGITQLYQAMNAIDLATRIKTYG